MIEYRKTAVTYQGDGNTSVFPFSFTVTDANSVRVSIYDKATDVSVELTRDYFVDMTANVVHYPGYAPGESVDAHAQPPKLPRGKNITIYRVTPIDQLADLGNKYPLPYIETMADKLTAILQEHDEMLGRAVMSQKGSSITPKELIDGIFRTSEKVDAAMNAANGSAAHAAASQTAAKSSEDAAREMTEQMHAVFSNSVTEIKNALSANYVPQEQANEMRIAILQRSRAYQVGDIAYHKALPSWARLECVKAGTTGATLPNLSDARENDHITDGTVEWIVGKTATVEQMTKSLTGKADCSLGNILESAKMVIKDAVIVRSLLAENGYIVFANGLIIQWGNINGSTITGPDQSTSFAPPLAISVELFSCGNVNIAGGNADVKWKTKPPVVSTIFTNGLLNIACNYFYADWRYTIRWLLIGF